MDIGEQAATGTAPSAYASAIQCRDRAGRGDVIAAVKGRSATFPTGKQVVVCVLLNVRKPLPEPDPAPEPTPADPGSVPAPAAAASLDLVTHTRALESPVAAGSEVGFRMRILNPAR